MTQQTGDMLPHEDQRFRVMIRVRPFTQQEKDTSQSSKDLLRSVVKIRGRTCAVIASYIDSDGNHCEKERQAFEFDECFWSIPLAQHPSCVPFSTQRMVFEKSGLLALNAALNGYNTSIFAYGQTGSGKTYTMLGSESDPGISLQLVEELFIRTQANHDIKTIIECSFFEIYNENVQDLFNKKNTASPSKTPKIRQHPTKGVYVDGLHGHQVTTVQQTKAYIMQGGQRRAAAETKMNQYSSRSHAIFQLKLTQIDVLRGTERRSTLNLVDLAGSEKLKQSGSTEERQKEAANINLSLTTLRRVIDILIENSKNKNPKNWKRPPYRESMLTYVLSDSLGGNAKAMMLATVSPYFNNIEDTLHTLQHAYGSRSIICSAKVNEEQSIKVLDSMREEIFALRAKIECSEGLCSVNTSNITADDTSVEVDDHKRETICALERELMVEKKEKENMVCEAALCQRNVVTQMLRNAFLLLIHKKRQEADKQTIDELMCKNQELEKDLIIAEDEIDSINQEFTAHVSLAGSRIKALKEEAATRDAAQADAQQQLRDLSDLRKENSSLKSQNEALTSSVRTLSTAKGELEAKLVRLHEEMLAATGAMDRERQSRRESEAKHAAEIQKMTEALESIRQRKDKYKLSLMEAKAEACAAQDTVDAIKGERELFITALQAKQSAAKRDTYTPRSVQRQDMTEAIAREDTYPYRHNIQMDNDVANVLAVSRRATNVFETTNNNNKKTPMTRKESIDPKSAMSKLTHINVTSKGNGSRSAGVTDNTSSPWSSRHSTPKRAVVRGGGTYLNP